MTQIALILVALPIVLGAYAYIGYPLLLWLIARTKRPIEARPPASWPLVSIVVPAYNEQAQIRGAIEALLAQDYPAERRQILVLSDASTDDTDRIVGEYASRGVELLRMPIRGGKTAAENASCAVLRGEIVVNTDSSIRLLPGTVRALVHAIVTDPGVGVASGRDVSVSASDSAANTTEAGYVGYEMWVRSLETRTGGIVGASGSGYAIRADLHRIPIREDLSRDFSAALTARLHGYRAVSVNEAPCVVPRTSSVRREYRRKVRTINRGMATLYHRRELVNPFRYGAFAWKLFSHKMCRWALPVSVIPAVVGLAILAPSYASAAIVLAFGVAGAIVAAIGYYWPAGGSIPRTVSIAAFGVSANLAVINALWRMVSSTHDHIWEPTRREAAPVIEP
jgi:cellulose synthase/poly-beta-1,6-N-acetylglucosamine synthase-like glycosyltransferase